MCVVRLLARVKHTSILVNLPLEHAKTELIAELNMYAVIILPSFVILYVVIACMLSLMQLMFQ